MIPFTISFSVLWSMKKTIFGQVKKPELSNILPFLCIFPPQFHESSLLPSHTHSFNMGVSDELAALRAKGTVKKNAADISSKSPRNLTLSTPEAEEAALRAKKERDKAKKVSAYGVGRYMWLGTYDELIVVLVFMVNRLWVE